MSDRYSRHEAFFGKEGQRRIQATKYAIVGLGGTGSHVVQQLAYLGGRDFRLIDKDRIDDTSLNRTVTAKPKDGELKLLKVDVAARAVREIQPGSEPVAIPKSFISERGFAAIRESGVVFGCVDRDSARLILNELCQAFEIPYVDLATDISNDNPLDFGGRVHISVDGERCLYCDDLLDEEAIRRDFETEEQRKVDQRIYGVRRPELGGTGPSVVSLNGVVASAGVLEFMVGLTGLRESNRWLEYRGVFGTLSRITNQARARCPYCKGSLIRGRRQLANLERYVLEGFGDRL